MSNRDGLPQALESALAELSNALAETLGAALEALVLYGAAAGDEPWHPEATVNLLLVVDQVTVELLDKLAEPLRAVRRQAPLGVMVLTAEELHGSCDVFPVKFLDMRQHYLVLHGTDPLVGLEISREHLRLRCEQEVKNALLRLRADYLNRRHRPELLARQLHQTANAVLAALQAVTALETGHGVEGREAVLARIEETLGVPAGPIREALAAQAGSVAELTALYGRFMAAVGQAAAAIDRL